MTDPFIQRAGHDPLPDPSSSADIEYHLRRARTERDVAYGSANAYAADAHMRLSALHLQRALTLQTVRRVPVGNVQPFPLNGS